MKHNSSVWFSDRPTFIFVMSNQESIPFNLIVKLVYTEEPSMPFINLLPFCELGASYFGLVKLLFVSR